MTDASTSRATANPGGRPAVISCQTDVETQRCSLTWTINNFCGVAMPPGEILSSEVFPPDDGRLAWRLSLSPGGESDASRDNMALDLTLVSGGETEVTAECSISVMDTAGIGLVLEDKARCTFQRRSDSDHPKWRARFPPRTELTSAANGLLSNGRLTIQCELTARWIVSRAAGPDHVQQGSTGLPLVTVNYEWKIDDFRFYEKKRGVSVVSSEFGSPADPATRWKLKLYPNGRIATKRACKYVKIFLKTASRNGAPLTAEFEIWLVNGGKRAARSTERPVTFASGKMAGYGFDDFITRNELFDDYRGQKYLAGGALVVGCRIKYLPNDARGAASVGGDGGRRLLANDPREAIAAARRALLSDMLGRETGDRAAMSDADREALLRLLWSTYVATGRELLDTACIVLNVVNACGLDRFKVVCEQALCSSIASDTAEDMLRLADEHNAGRLRTGVSEFIDAHRGPEAMQIGSVASTSAQSMEIGGAASTSAASMEIESVASTSAASMEIESVASTSAARL